MATAPALAYDGDGALRRDMRHDRARIARDRRELRRDLRNGNYAARHERRELRREHRDLARDRR